MNLFADFEFNGQNALEAIQFGAVLTDDNCNVISTFNEYVRPQYPVTGFVERLTGITNQRLQSAPDFPTAFIAFVDWIKNNNDGKSHIDFYAWGKDWKQVKKECKARGCIDIFNALMEGNNRIDYQKIVSQKITYKGCLMTKALKLGDVKKLYNIPDDVAHDALSDAQDVLHIYEKIEIRHIKYNEKELKRIFNEKKDHMVKMREAKISQTYNMYKELFPVYQNKMVEIDNLLFRKIKSGPADIFFANIENSINNSLVFSKKRECKYEPGSVSLLVTLFTEGENIYLDYAVYCREYFLGRFNLIINDENKNYIAKILRFCIS